MRWSYWWHRLTNTGYDGWMNLQAVNGRFRVIYIDGKPSQRMAYTTACDYAKMFDGKVEFIENHELTKNT